MSSDDSNRYFGVDEIINQNNEAYLKGVGFVTAPEDVVFTPSSAKPEQGWGVHGLKETKGGRTKTEEWETIGSAHLESDLIMDKNTKAIFHRVDSVLKAKEVEIKAQLSQISQKLASVEKDVKDLNKARFSQSVNILAEDLDKLKESLESQLTRIDMGIDSALTKEGNFSMKEKVVVDKAISLYTESFGDPAHEPIILIMGAMSSAVWWPDEFCSQLAKMGRYVIRYDHRDTGKSTSYEPGQAPYSVEELADDVVRVIDGYGLEAAHLVGMSLGGFLSQLVALKYPKRVKSLTLIASERLADADPDMPAFDPAIIEYHQRAESLDWSDRDAVVAYQVGAWRINSGTAHAFDAEKIQNIAELNFDRTPNILTTFNHTTLGGGERWLGRLNEIAVPTLIIHGTEDPVLPYVHGLALKDAIRGSKMLTLEGTGHELHHEDWPRIIQAIKGQTS